MGRSGTHSDENIQDSATILAMQGVRWLRMPYEWRTIEPQQGTYDWQHGDWIQQAAQPLGLSMLPTFYRTPQWASVNPNASDYQDYVMQAQYFPNYYNYVLACVQRYASWIRTVSIWNEIDSCWFMGGTANDYDTILQNCRQRINTYDSGIQTTCSGISATGQSTAADFPNRPAAWRSAVFRHHGHAL